MTDAGASGPARALAVQTSRDVSDSRAKRHSVRSAATKQWQPPEGLAPDEILAIIDAASTERDRLLLRVLWATGARITEALALRPIDIRRDSDQAPLFFSRKRSLDGGRRPISRQQVWEIVRAASERANVRFWPCVRPAMAGPASRLLCTRTSSATRESVRSCVLPEACRSRRSKQVGAAYRWHISLSATTKYGRQCGLLRTNTSRRKASGIAFLKI
jgi:hypothetical protein